jgi:myo-inositol-1(or 4)-monophosphatase
MQREVDWLDVCRRIAARQADLFAAAPTIAERSVYEGRGEGGDMTLELDRRCEDIVFEELEAGPVAAGIPLIAISEERGEVRLGEGGDDALRVVVDPIDGSMNVRRTIPSHSLSIAVASGPTMADVDFGFVHDFGAREEFAAFRGGGATLDGHPISVGDPDEHGLEVVGLESAEPGWILGAVEALEGKVYRLRAVGSIAITMSYVAAGRFDAMLSARRCRSVDAAASQLIVREVGGAVEFVGLELAEATLDLDARYAVAAARRDEHLTTVREAQDAAVARSA